MQVVVDWLYSGVITICMWILSLVKTILNLIFDIANISFFSEDVIGSIATRVYIIVGVLMLFKITISCIQYLISPDKAEDKENGFGGIIKRALISIALLALVPSIFNFAKSAQNAILDALPKVILGQENTSNVDEIGENIAYTTTLSFFGYSSDQCNDGSIGGLEGANSNPTFSSIDDILKNVREVTTAKCNGEKRYSFNWLLCIPAAVFLVVILVSMTVDVGIRVIKFGFLEIIAPIPVASYIDPKTSKKSFDSWVHNSISVYADLFIRLGVIYLVLHLFMILLPSFSTSFTLNDGTKLTWGRSMLVNVAIIISLILFAKNAPKFICEVLGIKGDGNIGDMFKRAGGLAGAGLGGLRTARSNYGAQKERWESKGKGPVSSRLRAAFSAAAGAGSATARGLKMATWDKKGYNDVRRDSFKNAISARDARTDRADNLYSEDYGWLDYQRDRKKARLGIPSGDEFIKTRYDTMKDISKVIADAKGHGAGKSNETPTLYRINLDTTGTKSMDEKVIYDTLGYTNMSMETARNLYQVAKNNGGQVKDSSGSSVTLTSAQLDSLGQVVQNIEKRTSYLKEAHLMASGDPASTGYLGQMERYVQKNTTMFNDEIMSTIVPKLMKYGINISDVNGILQYMEKLKEDIPKVPSASDPDYDVKYAAWIQKVEERADILNGLKDAFEEVEKVQKIPAQIAEERAQKAKKAVENDKKGS